MSVLKAFSPRYPINSSSPRFEIWFTVVIDPRSQKALWLRFTSFFSESDTQKQASTILWASLFDSKHPENHCFGTARLPYAECDWINNEHLFPFGSFDANHFTGELMTNKEQLKWDLNFQHTSDPIDHLPTWLSSSGIPKTKSMICSPFAKVGGQFSCGDQEYTLDQAQGVLTHIWGSYRVEQLFWTFVPIFDNDDEGWGLEIVTVKPKRFMLPLTYVTLKRQGQLFHGSSLWQAARGNVKVRFPFLEFKARVKDFDVTVTSKLNEAQSTAYIYRDPAGSDRYVEQSDACSVGCLIRSKEKEVRLKCTANSAVEFHGMTPWSDRSYLDPF